jgi:hypothetical protein
MGRQYDNRGRDQVNIENVQGNVILSGDRRVERSRSESILLRAVADEVTSRLSQSLHNAVLINLDKQIQPQQVRNPLSAEIKIGALPSQPLPSGTEILEVFERSDISGRLLILGDPGAGKTTTLLDLAKGLVERAIDDSVAPIPVIFALSTWKDPKQEMKDWLIAELKSKYGVRIDIGKKWIEDKQLLPLLDGLDEVKPEHQESCVKAINRLLGSDDRPSDLVVCSRREEYGTYQTQLQLNGAICIKELDDEQIQRYLASADCADLWHKIAQEPPLQELVKAPLLLSITVLAYQEVFAESWENMTEERWRNMTAEQWTQIQTVRSFSLQDLLDAYVRRMLTRETTNNLYRGQTPSQDNTKLWLTWLAKQLSEDSQTEFLIEALQPYHLPSEELQETYRVRIKWGTDLTLGLLFGIFVGLTEKLASGLIAGIIFGLGSGKKTEFFQEIQTIESLKWSWIRAKLGLKLVLFALLIVIPLLSFIFLFIKPKVNLFLGLSATIIIAVALGLTAGTSGVDVESKRIPNQGIWKSAASFLVVSVLGGTLLGVVVVLSFQLTRQPANWFITGAGSLVFLGLILGLNFGGYACIQHLVLRFVLYRNNLIPWDYARFLDYATERMFLQRIGGRYRFIHKLLQDHFAGMKN